MRELVLTCAMAMLGAGCVEVIPHIDEYDAGPPDVGKPSDAAGEPEVMMGPCQSGVRWTQGDTTPSQVMTPGKPCMNAGCHSTTSKTPMTLGGTLYPLKGEHDDDNCNGLNSMMVGAAIEILDLEGNPALPNRLQINPAGNFWSSRPLPPSFKVKIHSQGRVAEKMNPVSNGDCNYCHRKEDFMGAKGRIVPAAP
jgi:hypothetical protein